MSERMLRHVPTGDLYIYTSILAARGDMELVPVEDTPIVLDGESVEVADDPSAPVVEKKTRQGRKKKDAEEPAVQEETPAVQSDVTEGKPLDELLEE